MEAGTGDNHRFKFIRWVDHVLHQCLHQRSTLHEFRLLFNLYDNSLAGWVDDWLSYALTRKLLKKLLVHYVRVTGEAVTFLIANSPLLEHLSVSGSLALGYVDIDGSFASFKCLEISSCRGLQSIRLSDSKLVTIKYSGCRVPLVIINNVPLLTQLWIRLDIDLCLKDGFQMFSSLLPQLEMCKICCTNYIPWKDYEDFIKSNLEMCKLKKLVVSIGEHYCDNQSLLPIIHLLSVSPLLHKFVLQASHSKGGTTSLNSGPHFCSDPRASRDRLLREYRTTYFYFKEIEFVGYRGADTQLELIKILVDKYCTALDNIIIDPRCFDIVPLVYRPWDAISRHHIEVERCARLSAHNQLKEDDAFSKINVKIL